MARGSQHSRVLQAVYLVWPAVLSDGGGRVINTSLQPFETPRVMGSKGGWTFVPA